MFRTVNSEEMISADAPIGRMSSYNGGHIIFKKYPLMQWQLKNALEALALGRHGSLFRQKRNSQPVENKLALEKKNADPITLNSTISKWDLNKSKTEETNKNSNENRQGLITENGTVQTVANSSSVGNQSTKLLRHDIGYSTKVSGHLVGYKSTKGYSEKKYDCSGSASCEDSNSDEGHRSDENENIGGCSSNSQKPACKRLRSHSKGENRSHTYEGLSEIGAARIDSENQNKEVGHTYNSNNTSTDNMPRTAKSLEKSNPEKVHPKQRSGGNSLEVPKQYSGRRVTKMELIGDDSKEIDIDSFKPRKRKPFVRSGSKRSQKARKIFKVIKLSMENEEFYADRKWPNGVVKYTITDSGKYDLDELRERLKVVNALLRRHTCARLHELSEDEPAENYLVLDADTADYVPGMVGGKQPFGSRELFEGGQPRQHTAMMAMTMLGFYFECSRHDRDENIRVNIENIRADKLHHYDKLEAAATLPLPYDFDSATHPSASYWQDIGKGHSLKTLRKLDPSGQVMRTLGKHNRLLSRLDIVKINSIYGTGCMKSNNSE